MSGKRYDGITSCEISKRGGGRTSDQKSTKSISKKDTTRLNVIIDEANTILKKY